MDRLLTAGATSYSYDRNGNQLSAGSRTFTYDLVNRMRTTSASGTTTTYSYDGDGKRLQASTGNSPNAKTNFLWDTTTGLAQLLLERNGNNALQRRYVNAGGQPLYWSTSSTTANYLHWDPLGSVRNVTNASGATQLTYDYEPYGDNPHLVRDARELRQVHRAIPRPHRALPPPRTPIRPRQRTVHRCGSGSAFAVRG